LTALFDVPDSFHWQISKIGLSFRSAKDLRNRAEVLPKGPEWNCLPITPVYPTKNKINLFYRNPIECLEMLMQNPLLADQLEFTPFHVFRTAEKTMYIYTEWLSGDTAWSIQVNLFFLVRYYALQLTCNIRNDFPKAQQF